MSLRVAFYSHNGFGLGHVGRNLKLARALLERRPNADVLILTGASGLDGMAIPSGVDYIKLPSVRKQGTGRWRPQSLDMPMEHLLSVRRTLLLEAIRAYKPHLFVADFLPLGVEGELIPALEVLAARSDAKSVIGFRDILDEPASIRQTWDSENIPNALQALYDLVLVYGEPNWFDFTAYGLPPELPRYVGLLGEPNLANRSHRNGSINVLATCGGGADGYSMLAAALEGTAILQMQSDTPLACTAITGPLMAEPDVARLQAIAHRTGGRVRRFAENFKAKLAKSSVVVGMAGYNTVCEVLSSRRPTLVVPRFGPSEEQPIRAEILAARGLAENIPLAQATGENVAIALSKLLDGGEYPHDRLPELGGLANTTDALLDLVS